MTTKDFIKQVIDNLFAKFNLKILKYGYDEESNNHTFLISSEILKSKEFNDFNAQTTIKGWEANVEGTICFTDSKILENLFIFEEYINPSDNDALLSNLEWKEFLTSNDIITAKGRDLSKKYQSLNDIGNLNEFALAA